MGFEIADFRKLGSDLTGELVVYIETGPNPISEEAWASYSPDPGWMLNTPRGAQFNVLNVLGSPYLPTGEFTYYTDQSGYTWKAVAAVQNRVYPFHAEDYADFSPPLTTSAQAAYALSTPLPGTIQYNSNDKNHENIYYTENADGTPRLQYYVTDPWGNVYILKSVNAANDTTEKVAAAVDAAVLPEGWVKSSGYLENDTAYMPIYSGDLAHANEFRDSADSAWMQIEWGTSGITLASVIGDGMPIWGGNESGMVMGTDAADEIHGGDGADVIYGLNGDDRIWSDTGDNVISGGAGADTVYFGVGHNTLRDTLADMNGDAVYGFSHNSVLEITGAGIGRERLGVAMEDDAATLTVGNSVVRLFGDFSGGDFMAVTRGEGADVQTAISFVSLLPDLKEGVGVDPTSINGVANELFLTGDGTVSFSVEVQSAVSAYKNTLGYYKVGAGGAISETHLLFGNTLDSIGKTLDIGPLDGGEHIGFFLVQNGFGQYGNLPDDLYFVPGEGGTPLLYSASRGLLSETPVFHSYADYNPDAATQVLSGTTQGGRQLLIGFEDLAAASGDNDFQDVVIAVQDSTADLFII